MSRSLFAALHVAPFRRLFTAQVFSDFGDWFAFLATMTLITYRWQLGAGALTGFTVAICLPYVLFGSLAGAWVGRLDKRLVMVWADLARCVLCIGCVLAPNVSVLLALVAVRSVCAILFGAAK